MLGWQDTRPLGRILEQSEAGAIKRAFGYSKAYELLEHLPRAYAARGLGVAAETADEGEIVTIVGEVVHTTTRDTPKAGRVFQVSIHDGVGVTQATFFRATWQMRQLAPGVRAIFTGKLKFYRGQAQLQHPQYFLLGNLRLLKKEESYKERVAQLMLDLPFIPIYPARASMPSWRIFGAIHQVLQSIPTIEDPLQHFAPEDLPSFDAAVRGIHMPDAGGHEPYRQRLLYDEALSLGVVMALRKADTRKRVAPVLCAPNQRGAQLLARLPFALTEGQEQVLEEIRQDLSRTEPMQRLLQGEVGSGKTVVALLAMLQAVDAGAQCALLAPTEVLATQHAQSIASMLEGLDVSITLLKGSLSTAERQQALLDIVSGESNIIIGTHALIQEGVEFFNLGLCVVDEQHRFGVEQRDTLRAKGPEGLTPHLLVMTATPIPRTIAMTTFGDLSVSTLKQLPGGRHPIASYVVPAQNPLWVARMWQRLREEIRQGRQVYIVCPKIGGEHGVEEMTEHLSNTEFKGHRVAALHGQMPSESKATIMEAFSAGLIDVLVATTVIEVGVDVPNAAAMLIYGADAFGVSQLHQLRGRVGRGATKSICFFYTNAEPGTTTLERIGKVADTLDGFALAEIDLEYRQEGDVLGTEQSGHNRLKFLKLNRDARVIARANADATKIVEQAPLLARTLVRDIDYDRQIFIDKS